MILKDTIGHLAIKPIRSLNCRYLVDSNVIFTSNKQGYK